MMYAKINEDGSVAEFPYRSRDIDFLRPNQELPADVVVVDTQTNRPTLKWDQKASVDSVVVEGDKYIATYTQPEAKYADDAAKLEAIRAHKKVHEDTSEKTFALKAKQLASKYTESERSSWDQQRAEASAYTADNTSDTPLLSAIAVARGITVGELAAKVLSNAAEYTAAYGELLGKYQKNKELLAGIDLADSSTWDLIDSVVRL